jgi:hypothetical protein
MSKPALADLKVGDTVDVTRRNMVITRVTASGAVLLQRPDGDAAWYMDSTDDIEFTNIRHPEPPKPAHWPPQPGDVWRGRGTEWWVTPEATLLGSGGGELSSADTLLGMGPVLAHRKGDSR